MNTTNLTLGLFALRSYVSVLPETEKETALKIVGGGDTPENPTGLNINDEDDRGYVDDWMDFWQDLGCDPWYDTDEDGYIIDADNGCPDQDPDSDPDPKPDPDPDSDSDPKPDPESDPKPDPDPALAYA